MEYRLQALADHVGAELHGDSDCKIHGISALRASRPDTITFLVGARQRELLQSTRASAVILQPAELAFCPVAALVTADPYLAYARLTALFASQWAVDPGIHPSAVVDPSAQLGDGVRIGPHAVIGADVTLAEDVEIGPGCVVGRGCQIGPGSRLLPNVTIYHECVLGRGVLIHSGTVIGADGFGFAKDGQDWVKIHQLGRVIIGDGVEIGANTCIDRGAIEDTVIGDDVKLDDLVMVGHNVRVGARTAMAGCVGIAGSAEIGDDCMLGGGVGVAGHLQIASGTTVMGMSLVAGSLRESGVYASGMPVLQRREFQRNAVRFRQLDELAKRLHALEQKHERSNT